MALERALRAPMTQGTAIMTFTYVPIVRQAYDYSCGAASLASCLYYWGVWDGREPELYELLGTTTDGTRGEAILRGANRYGLLAYSKSNMTIDELKGLVMEGYTVILSIQAWGNYTDKTNMDNVWEDGHYVVLVGFGNGFVYLMDPAVAGMYRVMGIDELYRCWHDYSDDGEYDYHAGIIIRGDRPIACLNEIINSINTNK